MTRENCTTQNFVFFIEPLAQRKTQCDVQQAAQTWKKRLQQTPNKSAHSVQTLCVRITIAPERVTPYRTYISYRYMRDISYSHTYCLKTFILFSIFHWILRFFSSILLFVFFSFSFSHYSTHTCTIICLAASSSFSYSSPHISSSSYFFILHVFPNTCGVKIICNPASHTYNIPKKNPPTIRVFSRL